MIVFDPTKSDEEIAKDVEQLGDDLIVILRQQILKNVEIKDYLHEAEKHGRLIETYITEKIEDNDEKIIQLQKALSD